MTNPPMAWIYHATHKPKMVPADSDMPEGWADTPAAFAVDEYADAPVLDETQQAMLNAFADDPTSLTRDDMADLANALGGKATSRTSKAHLSSMLAAHLQE